MSFEVAQNRAYQRLAWAPLARLARPTSRQRRATATGGADRVRTDDFRLAKAALSQLSYSPS